MALTYYERKVIQRTVGVLNTNGVSFERVTAGTLDGKRAICAVLTPQTKSDEKCSYVHSDSTHLSFYHYPDMCIGSNMVRKSRQEVQKDEICF